MLHLYIVGFTALLATPSLGEVASTAPGQRVISDEVGGGNYTYYRISASSPTRLVLLTRRGDADLYVAGGTGRQPTYSPEDYELHSATCGPDVVTIPTHFPTTFYAGVYGHPRYATSAYELRIVHVTDAGATYEDLARAHTLYDSDYEDAEASDAGGGAGREAKPRGKYEKYKSDQEDRRRSKAGRHGEDEYYGDGDGSRNEDSALWNILIGLLKFLFDILL